jgi:polar amino acid transport system substrate-binding protein
MSAQRPVAATFTALALAALAACTSFGYEPTPLPQSSASATASPSASAATAAAHTCTNALESYTPPAAVPTNLSGYPTVDKIRTRGRLIVGGSATSMLLAARNPISGRIEGFDVDLARQVAKAIFGDSDKIERRIVTTAERIPVLQDGSVDLVISAMTINCARWQQIAFSAEYYRAGQKVLVPLGSKATPLDDLGGQRVCAPAGSTSLDKLKTFPDVKVAAAATHTGCLVKFQQGLADAITGDDIVLAGLAAQDPYAKVVGDPFTSEPYGIGAPAGATDLVRYVNAVLAQTISDGSWKASYNRWLAPALGPAPTPPTPVYGR